MITVKAGTVPPPDMENKPPDFKEYAFAPVCDLDHVTGYGKTEIKTSDLEIITACKTCGRPARYQTIQRTAEHRWTKWFEMYPIDPNVERWSWQNRYMGVASNYIWTKAERVRSITL